MKSSNTHNSEEVKDRRQMASKTSKLSNGRAKVSKSIPHDTQKALGFYVYALRDPRNHEVFYIGKGKGERILQHVAEAKKDQKSEKAKLKRINEIESNGFEVEHLFLRTGMENALEALAIEQAVIDAFLANRPTSIGASKLTNLVAGHEHDARGLASLDTILGRYGKAKTPEIDHPILVLKLNRKWKPEMSSEDLLKVSRKAWGVGAEIREKAEFAFVISFGIIRGVYEIDRTAWEPALDDKGKSKWQFDGKPTSQPHLLDLVGTDMGPQVRSQKEFQKFLHGFKPAA